MRAEKKQLIERNTSADVVVKDTEYFKNGRQQAWIHRCQDRRRAGISPEGIGEALAHCHGTCNMAHLEGELPMIASGLHKTMKSNGGDEQAHRQAKP